MCCEFLVSAVGWFLYHHIYLHESLVVISAIFCLAYSLEQEAFTNFLQSLTLLKLCILVIEERKEILVEAVKGQCMVVQVIFRFKASACRVLFCSCDKFLNLSLSQIALSSSWLLTSDSFWLHCGELLEDILTRYLHKKVKTHAHKHTTHMYTGKKPETQKQVSLVPAVYFLYPPILKVKVSRYRD